MPCGLYIRRRRENSFMREYPAELSKIATDWLAYVEVTEGITIQHNRNNVCKVYRFSRFRY